MAFTVVEPTSKPTNRCCPVIVYGLLKVSVEAPLPCPSSIEGEGQGKGSAET
jgi:hypothetical protein